MDLYIGNKLITKTDRAIVYDKKGNTTVVKSIDWTMYQVYPEVVEKVVIGNTTYYINSDKSFTVKEG